MGHLKTIAKGLVPYGLVTVIKWYKEFSRLGISKFQSLKYALNPDKVKQIGENRLSLLPDGSLENIDCIVDVGANIGAWSLATLSFSKPKKLIAIEPSPWLHSTLEKNLKIFPHAEIYKVAVGAEKGTTQFNVHSSSGFSSILQLKEDMYNYYYSKKPKQVDTVTVPIETLDELLGDIAEISLLKIDVQGYERFVLQGAKETLKKTRHIFLEVMFTSHYVNDLLFPELHNQLVNLGFFLQNYSHPVRSVDEKPRVLWLDAIYANENLEPKNIHKDIPVTATQLDRT
jgi:FkbM family methyltransferase